MEFQAFPEIYIKRSVKWHILLVPGSRSSFCPYYLQDGKEGNKVQNLEESQISHHDIGISHTVLYAICYRRHDHIYGLRYLEVKRKLLVN